MKSLAALLFHASATADKPEKAHAPKPNDDFAHVLQASLGDSRRQSRSDLASASSPEAAPEIESRRAPASDAVKDDLVEEKPAAQRIPVRRGRDKSETRADVKATGPESTRQDRGTGADSKATRLQQAHRGYSASPSRQATEAQPSEARRPEPPRAGQPSSAPESAQRAPTHRQAKAPPSTATEPSGERNMPPNTSAIVHTPASPQTASSRSGDQIRPEAWKIAGQGIEVPANTARNQGALAVPDGHLVLVNEQGPSPLPTQGEILESRPEQPLRQTPPQGTKPETPRTAADLVAPRPVDRNPALAKPEARSTRAQLIEPEQKAPILEQPPVEVPHQHGEPVEPRGASAPAIPLPVLPEPPVSSDQPRIPKPHPAPTMPSTSAASPRAPVARAYGDDVISLGENTSAKHAPVLATPSLGADHAPVLATPSLGADHAPVLATPSLGATTPSMVREPVFQKPLPRHPEVSQARDSRPVAAPMAVEPKAESARPTPVDAAPSIPRTSFGAKEEVKPSRFEGSSHARGEVLHRPTENHGETMRTKAPPFADSPIPGKPTVAVTSDTQPTLVPPRPSTRSSQEQAISPVGAKPAPTTSAPSPQDLAPVASARLVANPSTPAIQVPSLQRPPTSDTSMTRPGSRPVVPQPLSFGQEASSRPAHPLSARPHEDAQGVPVARRPERAIANHELPIARASVDSANPGTSAHKAIPERALPASHAVIEEPQRPAVPPPLAAKLELGKDQVARPLGTMPLAKEPTSSRPAHPEVQPRPRASTIPAPLVPEPVLPAQPAPASLHDSVPPTPTHFTDRPAAPTGPIAIPSAPTGTTNTAPASRKLDTLPFAKTSVSTTPAHTRGDQPAQTTSPTSSTPVSAQVVAPANDTTSAHSANHGERVPAAHRPKPESEPSSASPVANPPVAPADLAPIPTQPTETTSTKPGPLGIERPSVATVAPHAPTGGSDAAQADHASAPTGHQGPRAPHPNPYHAHPDQPAKPVEASAPSHAPVESQPKIVTSKGDDERTDNLPPVATASPEIKIDAPLPAPAAPAQPPAPPVAASAPAQPGKPMPRPDTIAPSAAPAVPANVSPIAPSLPSTTPSPAQAQETRTHRRVWTAKDEPRSAEAATPTTPVQQPQHARPHAAPAPTSGAAHDNQNSFTSQNPNNAPAAHAVSATASPSDRPADAPAPTMQASPSANNPSVPALASPSPVVAPLPALDARHARLPNQVSLAAQDGQDDGLSMTVMPHAAHMSIESSDGDLALHLRVRHGSADVTVAGSMAPLFETRAPEARAALASEGLNLGRFDLGQQGGGGQQGQPAPERAERAPEPATPYRQPSSNHEPVPGDGRIHVTA